MSAGPAPDGDEAAAAAFEAGADGAGGSDPGEAVTVLAPLPDPFAWPDGRRVATAADWPARAAAWTQAIVTTAHGGLPAPPRSVRLETLCESRARQLPGAPRLQVHRVDADGVAFVLRVLLPDASGPVPAIAYGDGCWWHLTDAAAAAVVGRGVALAWFDRTELATDPPPGTLGERRSGVYAREPGAAFGAIAAWAWGFHRCVDLLEQLPEVDAARVAVTGFSRGAKAALLAAATDPRIALAHDHAGGAGAAGPFRVLGAGAETLSIARAFPAWFGPELTDYVGREAALPFDQHVLLAAIAPRPLLLTYARDDRWANPSGVAASARAARAVYRLLGHEDALALSIRPGGHEHGLEDWRALLDFVAWRWQGGPPPATGPGFSGAA